MREVLVPLPPVDWGGLQVFVSNINAALLEAGWKQIVIVPASAENIVCKLRDSGVAVIPHELARFRKSIRGSLQALQAIPRDIAHLTSLGDIQNVDLVQAVGAHHPHGYLLSRKLKKPLVWQLHSSILPAPLRKAVGPIVKCSADAIMTNGRTVARAFFGKEDLGSRHRVFYAPVDAERFARNPRARAEIRTQLGIQDHEVVIGTVGNRSWQKNHALLIEAARMLYGKDLPVRFLIMGAEVTAYKEEYARTVQQPAHALNIDRPGYISIVSPGFDIPRWIHALDIFTLTSRAEGVPIALFEAMAASLPVISSDVGSIGEIVVPGRTGWLFSRGDLTSLVQKIEALVTNRSQRRNFGEAGKRRILDEFSIDKVIGAHVEAYELASRL